MSIFYHKKRAKESSFIKTLVNIATIISSIITCLRLIYYSFISVEIGVGIMLGVVFFVAIGNNFSKIILSIIALIIFALLYSGGSNAGFYEILKGIFTLIIVMVGMYIIIKGILGQK